MIFKALPSINFIPSSAQIPAGGLTPNLDPCTGTVYSELQTIEGLDAKWSKANDKLVFEKVPTTNSLVSKIPGGREIHDIKAYSPVKLANESINTIRRGGVEGASGYPQQQDWPSGGFLDSSDEEDWGNGSSYQVPGGYY